MPSVTISANVNDSQFGVAANDIYLNDLGNINLSSGIQAILENCAQAAKTRLGELVLNTNLGIPYFTTLFIGVPLVEPFNAALRAAWLAVEGVIEVVSLITTRENNTFIYTATIRTVEGVGELSANI